MSPKSTTILLRQFCTWVPLCLIAILMHVETPLLDSYSPLHISEAKAQDAASRRRSRRSKRRSRKDADKAPSAIGAGKAGAAEFDADLQKPDGVDAVLVLDASRSMTRTDPRRLRDQGAKLFLRFLTKQDRLGVIQFDRDDVLVADLEDVDTKNLRTIDKKIGEIPAEGGFTNLQAPLETALELLRKKGRKKATKCVILLSDGKLDPHPGDGTHEEISDQLFGVDLPGFKREGIRIYTLALSDDADRELLKRIATETGGLHWFTPDAETIHQKFSDLFLALKKPQVLEMKGGGFQIDPSVREATFYITRKRADKGKVELLDPKGAVITATKLPIGVKWFSGDAFDIVTVDAPEAGQWLVQGVDEPEGFAKLLTDLKLQVRWPAETVSVGDRLVIAARLTEQGEVFEAPDLTELLFYGYSVQAESGAGRKQSSQLNDEGKYGDEQAGDRIYSATIHLEEEGEFRASVGVTGPTFTRQQQFTFTAKGAQVTLELQEADKFAKTPERFRIEINKDLVRLRDLKVELVTQADGSDELTSLEAERDKKERTVYYVDPQTIEIGEYQVFAQVTGTNKGEPERHASARIPFTGTGSIEPEVKEEPIIAYVVALAISAIWAGILAFFFLVKKPVGKEKQIKAIKAYSHPEELLKQVEELKERSSETKREPEDSDKALLKIDDVVATDSSADSDSQADADEASAEPEEAPADEAAGEESPEEEVASAEPSETTDVEASEEEPPAESEEPPAEEAAAEQEEEEAAPEEASEEPEGEDSGEEPEEEEDEEKPEGA